MKKKIKVGIIGCGKIAIEHSIIVRALGHIIYGFYTKDYFSKNCNARVIWGGDEAIRNIRKIPVPERSVELVFADRYSLCVLDADSVMKLDEVKLKPIR